MVYLCETNTIICYKKTTTGRVGKYNIIGKIEHSDRRSDNVGREIEQ